MQVQIFEWEEGVFGDSDASSGHQLFINHLIVELRKAGHTVVWTDSDFSGRVPLLTSKIANDVLGGTDVLLVSWRWHLGEGYEERNAMYEYQMWLLRMAYARNVPVVVFDHDHHMTPEDFSLCIRRGWKVYSPEFYPQDGGLTLFFPNSLGHEMARNMLFDEKWHDTSLTAKRLCYVGNNYERFELAQKFLNPYAERLVRITHKENIGVDVYGNWLEYSPNRQHQNEVLAKLSSVNFKGRISQGSVINVLSQYRYTVHLAKDSYNKRGFITPRWLEAAASNTLAFIPDSFNVSAFKSMMSDADWRLFEYAIVGDGAEMFSRMMLMDNELQLRLLRLQQKLATKVFSTKAWIHALENPT